MLDFVIRNARLPRRDDTTDIGFEGGRISALERGRLWGADPNTHEEM